MTFYNCEKCGKQFNKKERHDKHINKKMSCVDNKNDNKKN